MHSAKISKATFSLMLAAIAAVGLMWGTSSHALADDFTCTSNIGAETKDNIVVPDDASCTLNGTQVTGNVIVGENAILSASGVDVDGNIQAEGATNVVVNNSSQVGGSIQIVQSGAASIENSDIDGDLQFFTNTGLLLANNNTIGGNLQADENTGGVTIEDNIIDGDLQCKQNDPPPTGSNNKAASLEDQCASLGDEQEEDGGDHESNDDEDISRYARIVNFPSAPYIGTWIIGDKEYTTNNETEFEQEYGAFAVGTCVEVEADSAMPQIATEIETVEDYECSGRDHDDDDEAEGELYGVINQFPADLIGLWVIGDKNFQATSETEFESDGKEFAVGMTVEVEFVTDKNGVHYAKEIELEYDLDDDDEDKDYGENEGAEGHAYGLLDSRPSGLVGEWVISGITYIADTNTELDDDNGLTVGERVKVKFTIQSDGTRLAHEIEETDDNGDVDADDQYKLVGFIQQMPAIGFIGTWKVADMEFTADLNTKFKQDGGLFAVGAYVEVEYSVDGSVYLLHEIETDIPPGAGNDDDIGSIESIGNTAQAAALNSSEWLINGSSYTVTAATQQITDEGELTVGQNVIVNSYTATDGSQVATRIRALGELQSTYLPLLDW